MKTTKRVGIIILAFLLLTPFMASSAGAVGVIRNGDFSNSLAEWVINPEIDPMWDPLLDGTVSLHPPSAASDGFTGTVIHQNLNVTGIAGSTFTFSMDLLKNSAYDGKTILVILTYIDTSGNVNEVDLVNPANADISDTPGSPSLVTENYTFPADAAKLIKIEIEKCYYGDFTADNISLTTDAAVTIGSIPAVTGLSASSGDYSASITITGSNFGTTEGFVSIGGSSEGVNITNWDNTSITATISEPARSGGVYVVAGYVESNIDFSFNVTSPHFTVDIMDDDVTVIKGQEDEFVVAVDFKNGFTATSGITFSLTDLNGSISIHSGFTPVSLTSEGGTLLKFETSGLTAGIYPLLINSFKDGALYCSVPVLLEVVTVKDIKFYTYDSGYNRVDIAEDTVTLTQQGAGIYYEVIDSNGDIVSDWPTPVVPASSDPTKLAIYPGFGGGYNAFTLDSGTATLTATTPDGFSKPLTVTIAIPDTPKVTSATIDGSENPLTITNKDTAAHIFLATGTEGLGYGSEGLIYLKTDEVTHSNDNKTITREFTVDVDSEYTSLGTTFFYAFTSSGYPSTDTSKRGVPITIINDPSYSAISVGVKIVDPAPPLWAAEHFTLEFYDATSGSLRFSRESHLYHGHGDGEFTAGAIPPDTYKIKCVPLDESVDPQWYPNSSSIGDAQEVAFSAGQETEIYFFLRSALPPAGHIWTKQNSGLTATQSLYWVHFINAGTGWAVGGNGIYTDAPDPVIIKTTDGGENWINQTSTVMTENLYSCYFVNENYGWAVGGSARDGGVCKIYRTTDGGQNWTEQTSATYRRPTTVFFIDQYNGWICGDGGTIQHTINGGGTWTLQTTPTTEHIIGIRFVDANNGWAGAQHGVILHTTNGGTTWAPQTSGVEDALSSFAKRHFGSMDFVHTTDQGDKGWVVGIDGTIVHTDDGGANWAVQTSNTSEKLWAVDFVDSQHGVVVGANGLILRTADGGVTWTAEESGSDKTLIHVCVVDQNTAWAVSGSTILKCNNRGNISGDNTVNLADAILALKVVAGMNPAGVNPAADVNGDNKIGLAEAIYILQYVAGLR